MKKVVLLAVAMMGVAVLAADYAAFRKELRAFYPNRFQNEAVKDPRSRTSYEAIERELKACALELEPLEPAKNFEELRDIYWRNFARYFKGVTDDYSKYGASSAQVFDRKLATARRSRSRSWAGS